MANCEDSIFAGMATCLCRSTWRSWSAVRQKTWSPVRRLRAPSGLSARRTSPTWLKKSSTRSDVFTAHSRSLSLWNPFGGLTVAFVISEPDQGAGRLLSLAHEAVSRQQGPRAGVSFRLRWIHPLALCQLISRPPVTNQDALLPTHTI